MKKLSICIPTYNRSALLENCLRSIVASRRGAGLGIEVCVSDNGSTDDTEGVVRRAQASLPIRYRRNERNLGIPRNFLQVVAMAEGEFAWLLGDDDLLLPTALADLAQRMQDHPGVDHFFANAFQLDVQFLRRYPHPFDTANLPAGMALWSTAPGSRELPFFGLIDPAISFDFLGGMFLSVFRRQRWNEHAGALDREAIADSRTFSHFDNTFPHVKILARALAQSRAHFSAAPLTVCLSGAREWAPMGCLVRSVRLVEALDEYRRCGLPFLQYVRCRNFALRTFLPDLAYMFVRRKTSGFEYLELPKMLLSNAPYPNVYASALTYAARKGAGLLASGKAQR